MTKIEIVKELEGKTIACKKLVIENDNVISIERFYVEYTEDQERLKDIKTQVGTTTFYEIISIWNKA
jgi:hypothetical protein